MCKVICVASQRGGTGKTATAVNLAASLALLEKKVVIVDCDPQCNASLWSGMDEKGASYSLYHMLTGEKQWSDLLTDTKLETLQVIPSGFELYRGATAGLFDSFNKKKLADKISGLKEIYDYIIIDTPPSIGFLSLSAMAASDFLLIPIRCNPHALEALGQFLKIVKTVQKINTNLRIGGIVFTFCKNQDEATRFFSHENVESLSSIIFPETIPYDPIIEESFDSGIPAALYDIESAGAVAYLDLAYDLENYIK